MERCGRTWLVAATREASVALRTVVMGVRGVVNRRGEASLTVSVIDFGGGVMMERGGDEVTVTSEDLELHWSARRGTFPGTAVQLEDGLFEVVDAEAGFYRLAPWRSGETARVVVPLDRAWVKKRVATREDQVRREQVRRVLMLLLPLSGALPRVTQMRLEREYDFPAQKATTVSALTEMVPGALGVVQSFIFAFSGEWVVPPGLRWLIFVGPVMFGESLIRLKMCFSQGEPFGSLFLSPVELLEKRAPDSFTSERHQPTAVAAAEGGYDLVLAVPDPRPDWHIGGVLRFRGRCYRLLLREGAGEVVHYSFDEVEGEDEVEVTLRLAPPPLRERVRDAGEGIVTTAWRALLLSFAPGRYQKTWFERHGTSPLLVTLVCALAEAGGGLQSMLEPGPPGILGILDLFFVVEGCVRLALALVRRGPVGSLMGLPLRPLYARWTAVR